MDKAKLPSIRKAYNFAWVIYKKNFVLFIACLLSFFALWVILEVIVIAGQRFGFILWLIAHISFFVVFAGLQVGFISICLDLHDGKQVAYIDIFRELRTSANFLLMQLIYFVMVLLGLVLLIVPGAYLGTRYTFFAFTFTEGNLTLKQSFQRSADTGQYSKWFLFWFALLMLLFNIAGASILGIGLLVTVPLSVLMKVHVYRQLNGQGDERI